jgi:hypothetical protein
VIPPKVWELLLRPPVAGHIQIDNAWDPAIRERDVSFKHDGMTCKRSDRYSTVAVRGRRPMTAGVHVWAITWKGKSKGINQTIGK